MPLIPRTAHIFAKAAKRVCGAGRWKISRPIECLGYPCCATPWPPLRAHLAKFPFVGGAAPNFADYIVLGGFIWAGSVATVPVLQADDTLRPYIERGFDLYDGMAAMPACRTYMLPLGQLMSTETEVSRRAEPSS